MKIPDEQRNEESGVGKVGFHFVEVSLAVYTLHAGAGSVSNYGGRDFRHRHKMSQSNAGLGLAGT